MDFLQHFAENWYTYSTIGGIALFLFICIESFVMFINNRGNLIYHIFIWVMGSLYVLLSLNELINHERTKELLAIYDYLTIIYIFMVNAIIVQRDRHCKH